MQESYAIPTPKILERLRFENPWWATGMPTAEMDFLPRRLYFNLFYPHVKDRSVKRALVLMGPRRVGKTVMMHHAIGALMEEHTAARKVFFIGIDNPIYIHLGLEELLKLAMNAAGQEDADGLYVFFDEIQYLKDWERHLKILVDSYPQTKFVVSGSAAAALRIKSSESGAGRFTDFMLPPLTFQEYLYLKKLLHLVKPKQLKYRDKLIDFFEAVDIKELNKQFFEYINYGGYPEVIFSETIQQNMSRYIKGDIIDKVLLRDLPSLYGIRDVQELNRFFAYLAYNTGREFSFEKICKESGIDKVLLRKYMEYLEAAFLIKVIHKIDDTAKQFKRVTGFKVYLTNTSLRSALFSPVEPIDEEAGNMVETVVFSQWLHREQLDLKYASWKSGRTEGEVDMVLIDDKKLKPVWCVEIKWSNRYIEKPGELKSLTEFCEKNKLDAAIVTTVDKEQTLEHRNISLTYVPAAVYAYSVGVRTLQQKQP
ncbi:ATP-binding protein [Agriterribacter sp.]|uniref:ATP-binding protein n=1 Tax=Agriterribacter sp. TaxID=2821509 RepID=UPI002CC9F90C|nr:ATP-binding protein [Agriterribacter sp.]HRO45343.1 ATP-binding protein [Agriterribacter sp.]HRQ17096.1 ATP-binding protein [Agriterribacter sp.]